MYLKNLFQLSEKIFSENEAPLFGLTSKKKGKPFLLFACSIWSALYNSLCFRNSALMGLSVFLLTTLFSPAPDSFSDFAYSIFRTLQAKLFLKLFTKTSKIFLFTNPVFFPVSLTSVPHI